MKHSVDILHERERLIASCEAQRNELTLAVESWEGLLAKIDRVGEGVAYLRKHPLILAILMAVPVALRGRGLLGWAKRGFFLWRTYRTLRNSGIVS